MRIAFTLVAVFIAALAGCATPVRPLPPVTGPPGPALAVAPLVRVDQPTPDRPTSLAGGPDQLNEWVVCLGCGEKHGPKPAGRSPCSECGGETFRSSFSRPYRPRLDLAAIDSAVVATLNQRGSFTSVTLLKDSAPGDTPLLRRGAALMRSAKTAGADWLLEIVIENARVRMVERNGLHGLKVGIFIASALIIFPCVDPPNWFIAGEDYGVDVRGEWRLLEVSSGIVLKSGRLREMTKDSFAAFGLGSIPSRNFFFAGLLRVPNCLEEEDWEDISAQLQERQRVEFLRGLVILAEDLRAPIEAESENQ